MILQIFVRRSTHLHLLVPMHYQYSIIDVDACGVGNCSAARTFHRRCGPVQGRTLHDVLDFLHRRTFDRFCLGMAWPVTTAAERTKKLSTMFVRARLAIGACQLLFFLSPKSSLHFCRLLPLVAISVSPSVFHQYSNYVCRVGQLSNGC